MTSHKLHQQKMKKKKLIYCCLRSLLWDVRSDEPKRFEATPTPDFRQGVIHFTNEMNNADQNIKEN